MTNQEYALQLRKIANVVEQYPEMPQPYIQGDEVKIFSVHSKEELKQLMDHVGGTWVYELQGDDPSDFAYACRTIKGVTFKVAMYRYEVCKKIEIGTKKVLKQVSLGYREEEVEVPIIMWECP